MYLGRIVEQGPTSAVFADPLHPYTKALLEAVPRVGRARRRRATIAGEAPGLEPLAQDRLEVGCPFAPRCPLAEARCRAEAPALMPRDGDREAACHLA